VIHRDRFNILEAMNKEIKQRLKWIELYEETNSAGLVCRRCGFSRPILRKWYKRCKERANGVKS